MAHTVPMLAVRERRVNFVEQLCSHVAVYPFSAEIARLAGRIGGEKGGAGISISFEDLIIGATALHFEFGVATLNVRRFERVPGLKIITL